MPTSTTMTYGEITAWLVARVSSHTGLPSTDISPELAFANYGLDSVQAVSLSVDIEDHFGLSMPPTLTWDYPTIDQLAKYLVVVTSGCSASSDVRETSDAGHQ